MTSTTLAPELTAPATKVTVDVVVPVYNEEAALTASIRRLHGYLRGAAVRMADRDRRQREHRLHPAIASGLAGELPGVRAARDSRKGRGRALRAAWSASDADVVCYMDVDLSTDLEALLPLLAPLLSGHSDVAIGTRLTRGVARRPRAQARAHLARLQPAAAHAAGRALLATRSAASRRSGPTRPPAAADVRDDGWFFDTELLVSAQRAGLRIHEVPVDWVDDPDSRVDIVATVLEDLRGSRGCCVSARRPASSPSGWPRRSPTRCSTCCCAGAGRAGANAAALAITAVANTGQPPLHLRRARQDRAVAPARARGAVFVLTLGLTTGALALLHGLDPGPTGRSSSPCWSPERDRRHGHPLHGVADLGVRAAPPPARRRLTSSQTKGTTVSTSPVWLPTLPRRAARSRSRAPAWRTPELSCCSPLAVC